MRRKIIQIVDVPDSTVTQGSLTALCDDGSVWYLSGNTWEPIKPQIPQTALIDDTDNRFVAVDVTNEPRRI